MGDLNHPRTKAVLAMFDYTDKQFEIDVKRAKPNLEALAEKARKGIKDGSARKYPG